METPKVFESEYKFCLILWENEPIKSGNLVKLCKERLGWKSTTTYTVIKRLSERGVIKNENCFFHCFKRTNTGGRNSKYGGENI